VNGNAVYARVYETAQILNSHNFFDKNCKAASKTENMERYRQNVAAVCCFHIATRQAAVRVLQESVVFVLRFVACSLYSFANVFLK
jgi:hypothetical protein